MVRNAPSGSDIEQYINNLHFENQFFNCTTPFGSILGIWTPITIGERHLFGKTLIAANIFIERNTQVQPWRIKTSIPTKQYADFLASKLSERFQVSTSVSITDSKPSYWKVSSGR